MSETKSDPRPVRSWHFFLDDMIAFAKDVRSYTAGMDQREFERNGLVFDATLRKLELIGDTAQTLLDLLQNRRSLRVEWYIVILIVVEIVLTLYELFFHAR